jgi:predicted glycoside hydrolase/deacetylase ChbG (UPF0249 family)
LIVVHLNLTDGSPLFSPNKVSTFVDEDGLFSSDGKSLSEIMTSLAQKTQDAIFRSQATREILLQLQTFQEELNQPPTFLNFHRQLNLIAPWFDEILMDMAKRYDCSFSRGWVIPLAKAMGKNGAIKADMSRRRERVGRPSVLSIANHWMGERPPDKRFLMAHLENLYQVIGSIQRGEEQADILELIVHPAISSDSGMNEPYRWMKRSDSLLLPMMHRMLDESGVLVRANFAN